MDLLKAIRDLYEEKKRLDAVIASLELMRAAEARTPTRALAARRRGRKSMSREEREEVSERMKKYWAARRGNHNERTESAETTTSTAKTA